MKIIPVLDLKGGLVVRGVGGRRDEYRPLVSQLTTSCQPLEVAEALRACFGLNEVYLADLDAIGGAAPALATCSALQDRGFQLQVDAGVRDVGEAGRLAEATVKGIIVGLETVRGPDQLMAIGREFGERVIFSLDLKGGRPLGDPAAWESPVPWSIAVQAIGGGVRRLLVLDLDRVGEGTGTGTEELCQRLTTAFPQIEVLAGGGVRGLDDLRRLRQCGVSGVLVASALHDGRLRREDLESL